MVCSAKFPQASVFSFLILDLICKFFKSPPPNSEHCNSKLCSLGIELHLNILIYVIRKFLESYFTGMDRSIFCINIPYFHAVKITQTSVCNCDSRWRRVCHAWKKFKWWVHSSLHLTSDLRNLGFRLSWFMVDYYLLSVNYDGLSLICQLVQKLQSWRKFMLTTFWNLWSRGHQMITPFHPAFHRYRMTIILYFL